MVAANSINESTTGITGFTGTAFVGSPVTNHAVIVGGSTSSAITNIGPSATAGQVLQSGGSSANPAYSTPTYPSASGTSGKVLVSDGTNNVYSTPTFPNASATSGKIIISDGTNWIASTPTFPNAAAQGDLLYGSAASTWTQLAKDTNSTRYLSNTGTSNNPAWAQVALTTGVSGILPIANGGTNASSMTTSNGIIKYDGTRLVTSTATIDASNRYTNSSQPGCSVYLDSGVSNVTGDSTNYTILFANVQYDTTSSYNSGTGIYTVPVTGRYFITCGVTIYGVTSSHTIGVLKLNTPTKQLVNYFDPAAIQPSSSNGVCVTAASTWQLNANDTVSIIIQVQNGTKVVGLPAPGGSQEVNWFCIHLLS